MLTVRILLAQSRPAADRFVPYWRLTGANSSTHDGGTMSVQKWLRVVGIALMLVVPLAAEPPQERAQNFVPLRQPRFVPAAQAEFLKNEDRVVGVAENGVAKAYEPDVTAR